MFRIFLSYLLLFSFCYGSQKSHTSDLSPEFNYLVRVPHPGVWYADGEGSCSFVGNLDDVVECGYDLVKSNPFLILSIYLQKIPGIFSLDTPPGGLNSDGYEHMKAIQAVAEVLDPHELELPNADALEQAILKAQAHLVDEDWYPDPGYRNRAVLVANPRFAPGSLDFDEWKAMTSSEADIQHIDAIFLKIIDLARAGVEPEVGELLTQLHRRNTLTVEQRRFLEKCYGFAPSYKVVPKRFKQLLATFLERLADSEEDPIHLAAWIHHSVGEIHPFQDGNGRIARLLMNLTLMRAQISPVIFLSGPFYDDVVTEDFKDNPGAFEEYLRSQISWIEEAKASYSLSEIRKSRESFFYGDDDDSFDCEGFDMLVAEMLLDPLGFEQRWDARYILLQIIEEYAKS